jgi:hypothetical protein
VCLYNHAQNLNWKSHHTGPYVQIGLSVALYTRMWRVLNSAQVVKAFWWASFPVASFSWICAWPGMSPFEVLTWIFDVLLRRLYVVLWNGEQVFFYVVNVTWTGLNSLAFMPHVFNHFCIASRLVCSFCEAMPGSLSVANTAVSSAVIQL